MLRNGIFLFKSILQQRVERIDLAQFLLLVEWLDGYHLSVVGLDIVCKSGGGLYLLQTRLHDFLEMDVFRADSVDGPLFNEARPVLEGDLYREISVMYAKIVDGHTELAAAIVKLC